MHRPGFRVRSLVCAIVVCFSTAASAEDWPQWGGQQRDCVWHEDGIVDSFPTSGLLPRVWSAPVGEGYSGPAVADGRVRRAGAGGRCSSARWFRLRLLAVRNAPGSAPSARHRTP